MPLTGLNRISPYIRQQMLLKINNNLYPQQVFNGQTLTPDIEEYISPSDSVNNNRHSDILTLTSNLNIVNASDGYSGNVRRGNYQNQWDKRGDVIEIPNIWDQIENPDATLMSNWKDSKRNQFNSYLDYTNSIFGTPSSLVNVIGGIVSGNGAGLSLGGGNVSVVSDFDIQQTLAGRIYSTATGDDTPLGKFGMKAAAISMANNTLAKTQKNIVDQGVNWLKGKLTFWDKSDDTDFDISSNSITNKPGIVDDILSQTGLGGVVNTVASGLGLGNLLSNVGQSVGIGIATSQNDGKYIELPSSTSLYNADSVSALYGKLVVGNNFVTVPNLNFFLDNTIKIFDRKHNNEQLISWTGKKNVLTLYQHLNINKFGPGYENDSRIKTGALNVSQDYLESLRDYIGNINQPQFSGKRETERYAGGNEEGTGSWMEVGWQGTNSASNNIEYFGFDKIFPDINYTDINNGVYYGFDINTGMNNNTLLDKTQSLFRNSKINTIISAFGNVSEGISSIQSAVNPMWGMSKGRNLLTKDFWDKKLTGRNSLGYDNPYCRVWTWHNQYRRLSNLIRPFWTGQDGDGPGEPMKLKDLHSLPGITAIRPYLDNFTRNTVLLDSGFVKIAPYYSDWKKAKTANGFTDTFVHRYMFSIENLAWKDILLENNLCASQIGPNGGRLMWFAPYNLKFSEATNVKINEEDFIGRGEPVYTYVNTARTGNLSFTLIVDHSAFMDYMVLKDNDAENDEQRLLRWNAGCDIPDFQNPNNAGNEQAPLNAVPVPPTEPTKVDPEPDQTPPDSQPAQKIPEKKTTLTRVYYPNDFSGVDESSATTALTYVYQGNGNNIYGKGAGYEMGGNVTLSNYNTSTTTMTSIASGQIVKNLLCSAKKTTQNNRVVIGGGGLSLTLQIKDDSNNLIGMAVNRTVTDKVSNYGGKGNLDEFLPRVKYKMGYSYWDITNNGLNTQEFDGGRSFKSFYDDCMAMPPKSDLIELFVDATKVYITGYANTDGYNDDNSQLAGNRAKTLFKFIQETLGGKSVDVDNPNKGTGQPATVKKILNDFTNTDKWIIGPAAKTVQADVPACSSGTNSKGGRYADIQVVINPPATQNIQDTPQVGNGGNINSNTVIADNNVRDFNVGTTYKINGGRGRLRYDEERTFFKAIEKDTDLLMNTLKEKIGHFVPAFHSTSPEGFNARLGFLHQCTRQGPTVSATDADLITATNLSFGRPPVCVLRIGDFYHTRVFIESLNIEFENNGAIQWDLNPEGIGVQPMFANVSMSFKFMGGQDLSGAISRLQNAVTFNYYANQSVYDDRSDIIYNRTQKKYGSTNTNTQVRDENGEQELNPNDLVLDNYLELYDPFTYVNAKGIPKKIEAGPIQPLPLPNPVAVP